MKPWHRVLLALHKMRMWVVNHFPKKLRPTTRGQSLTLLVVGGLGLLTGYSVCVFVLSGWWWLLPAALLWFACFQWGGIVKMMELQRTAKQRLSMMDVELDRKVPLRTLGASPFHGPMTDSSNTGYMDYQIQRLFDLQVRGQRG